MKFKANLNGREIGFHADDEDGAREFLTELFGEEDLSPDKPSPGPAIIELLERIAGNEGKAVDLSPLANALERHSGSMLSAHKQHMAALNEHADTLAAIAGKTSPDSTPDIVAALTNVEDAIEKQTALLGQILAVLSAPRRLVRDDDGRPLRAEIAES